MSAAPAWLRDLEQRVEVHAARAARRAWPCPDYEREPVRFAREVLDRELWQKQAEWVQAAAEPDARVSVVSGHKTGKTLGESTIALWAWATFEPVRVFLFAPKIEHIEKIALWKEIEQLYKNSGRCAACRAKEHAQCRHDEGRWRCRPQPPCAWCSPIGDASWWNEDPTTGLRSPDGRREILAYTAQNVDALGGLSGPKMFFIFDEAGGIKPVFFEAMHGNAAGGATMIMAGNPLHTSGEQYDAHHSQKHKWRAFEISSEETPNAKTGEKRYPGLATREWCDDRAEAWGRDSSTYDIRVRGRFPRYAPGQLLRVDEVEAAERRWATTEFRGRLQLGVDVAFTGDEAVIAPRRGYKIGDLVVVSNTDPDALAAHVAHVARDLRLPHERPPIVAYDAQGKAGRDFGEALRAFEKELEVVPVRTDFQPRDPGRFADRRTELAHGFAAWIKRGGAIPTDAKLEGEIGWMVTRPNKKDDARPTLPSNDEFKKLHGRSPDRFDACKLACVWVTDADGMGDPTTDARQAAVARPDAAPALAPMAASREEDFEVDGDAEPGTIFDRHAMASAGLWGRA